MKAGVLVRADQVRIDHPQARVHRIAGTHFDPERGHVYLTGCEQQLAATAGAMRTTRELTCGRCLPPEVV